jgi:hypothetical protein
MKKLIFLLFLSVGFYVFANKTDKEKLLSKAEKQMLKDPQEAFLLATKVYKQKDIDQKSNLRALYVLTNVSNLLQKPLDVIKYGKEALALSKGSNDVLIRVKVLGILGNTYQSMQLNERTRMYLDQAEGLLSSSAIPDSLSYIKGNIYYLKAMNYFYTLDSDIALSYFDKAVNEYMSSKHPLTEINLKFTYLNKGFALIEQNHLKEAEDNFQLAAINTTETVRPYPAQFVILQESFIKLGKAKIYSISKRPDLSNKILFEILEKKSQIPNVGNIEIDIYKLLSENFLQLKNMDEREHYENLYIKQLSDSNKKTALLVDQLIQNEQMQNDDRNLEIKTEYTGLIALVSIILFLIILFLFLKNLQFKRKVDFLKKEAFHNL